MKLFIRILQSLSVLIILFLISRLSYILMVRPSKLTTEYEHHKLFYSIDHQHYIILDVSSTILSTTMFIVFIFLINRSLNNPDYLFINSKFMGDLNTGFKRILSLLFHTLNLGFVSFSFLIALFSFDYSFRELVDCSQIIFYTGLAYFSIIFLISITGNIFHFVFQGFKNPA